MDYITWSDELSVGNPVLDAQRKEIINIYNSVKSTPLDGLDFRSTFQKIIYYFTQHFRNEEAFIISNSPELVSRHFPLHSKFIVDIYAIRDSLGPTNSKDVRDNLCQYLEYWVTNHLQREDLLYRPSAEAAG